MITQKIKTTFVLIFIFLNSIILLSQDLKLNEKDYFETQGLNVIVLHDIYPEGHQGGITIIQHGNRVAANGNVTLQPTPGQWQPYPKFLSRNINKDDNEIVASLMFPDSNRINSSNQPIIYPDLELKYELKVRSQGNKIFVSVDLEKPLPKEWEGKVGFSFDLFPGYLFGKSYMAENKFGVFPRYANSPVELDQDKEYEAVPLATANKIVIAPEDPKQMLTFENKHGDLQLIDGRVKHNNGWFVIRSLVATGKTKNAIEWVITPNIEKNWISEPVIHISQLGYHPKQEKLAILELDQKDKIFNELEVYKILENGEHKKIIDLKHKKAELFLRYNYLTFDFSSIEEDGIYILSYGEIKSNLFTISKDIYSNGAWQPVLEYFLPVQMCHTKVFEKYRVWHDRCHLDDALMAPENIRHFDGYNHGSIPNGFSPLEHIEGLNRGGWHDAGDYDLRIESQVNTVKMLAYLYEEFDLKYDQTLINHKEMITEIHHPDGKPDVLQQIEHGLYTILPSFNKFGKLYRGIIVPTLRQYAILGDAGSMTDNKIFKGEIEGTYSGSWYNQVRNKYDKYFTPQKNENTKEEYVENLDDRLVFLEENPARQIGSIAGLAAASRVLKGYNNELSSKALFVAEELWKIFGNSNLERRESIKIEALAELYLTTGDSKYETEIINRENLIIKNIQWVGWSIGRIKNNLHDEVFIKNIDREIIKGKELLDNMVNENPFGVPYKPHIWGAGWGIQRFGVLYYFVQKAWPEVFDINPILNSLNFVLGNHPGKNTSSFVSNVGTKSQTIAYGINRGDWSFIPGGVVSGTNLVRPDFPEMKDWPFMWQQTEYVIGGGATNYMFLALAADKILNNN